MIAYIQAFGAYKVTIFLWEYSKCFQMLLKNNLDKFKYRYNISIHLGISRSEANPIKSINQQMYVF